MTTTVDRYKELKSKVDGLQREADKAEGALGQAMAELKEKHGCKTLEEAEKLAAKKAKESIPA